MKHKSFIKKQAVASSDKPSRIRAQSIVKLGESAEILAQENRSKEADRKLVQRQRSANREKTEVEPQTRESIPRSFFEAFGITSRNQSFLLHDDGPEHENRIVIFATQRGLDQLKQTRVWYVFFAL